VVINVSGPATITDGCCQDPPDTGGSFNVRVKFLNTQDAGHVSGPFSRSEAGKAAIAALSRAEVQSATIEEVV